MAGLGGVIVNVIPPGYADPHNWTPVIVPPSQGAEQGLGFIAENFLIRPTASNTAALTSGTIYLARIQLPGGLLTITNVVLVISTAGATLTAGQCFAGVYDDQGNQIGITADQSGNWTSNGTKTIPLAGGPFTIYSPFINVAVVSNGTTNPAFIRGAASGGQMPGAGATLLYAVNGTGQTALPATFTYSASTPTNSQGFWAGLS